MIKIREKMLKWIFWIAVALSVSGMIEMAVFNFHALTSKKVDYTFYITNELKSENPAEGLTKNRINRKEITCPNDLYFTDPVTYRLEFPESYLNRLYLEYTTDTNFSFIVIWENENDDLLEMDSTALAVLSTGIKPLNVKADHMWIQIESTDIGKINEITLTNKVVFNYQRYLMILAIVSAVLMLLFGRRVIQRLEIVFVVFSMMIGIAVTYSHGMSMMSWDEHVHLNSVYQMSYSSLVDTSGGFEAYMTTAVPGGDTPEENLAVMDYLNQLEDGQTWEEKNYIETKPLYRLGHIFQAIGWKMARFLGASFSQCFYFANLTNLISYDVIIGIALYLCRYGKRLMFILALMPTPLVLATAFSYDAFVIALLFLGFALYTREYASGEKLNWRRVLLTTVVLFVGMLPKAVYFPLLFLMAFMPKEKFRSRKERYGYWVFLIICMMILAATFVVPTLMSGFGGADVFSDPRGGDASAYGQLIWILQNPCSYAKLLLNLW